MSVTSVQLGGPAADARARAHERRIRTAVATSQTLLVIRILSVLLSVPLLPQPLPTVTLRLDPAHSLTVNLTGVSLGMVLLISTLVSGLEMYQVARLADRVRYARFGVLAIEALAILVTAGALALGASLAALPLAAAVGATCLLLRNQVRWAFRLQMRGALTGRRQGGVYQGYAAGPLGGGKAPQDVGYSVTRPRTG